MGDDFNLGLFVSIIRRSLIWIILLLVLACGFALLYLRYSQPIYQTSVELVGKKEQTERVLLGVVDPLRSKGNVLQRDIKIIKSAPFIALAISKLKLGVSYYKEGRTRFFSSEVYKSSPFIVEVEKIKNPQVLGKEIYFKYVDEAQFRIYYRNGGEKIEGEFLYGSLIETEDFIITINESQGHPFEEDYQGAYFFTINDPNEYAMVISKKIQVTALDQTIRSFEIKYQDQNRKKVQDIVSAISQYFMEYDRLRESERTQSILAYLDNKLIELEDSMIVIQDTLKRFRLKNNYLNPTEEINRMLTKMGAIDNEKATVLSEKKVIQWFYDYLDDIKNMREISFGLVSQNFGELGSNLSKYRALEFEKQELLLRVTPGHPEIKYLEQQIESIKNDLSNDIENVIRRLDFSLSNLSAQEAVILASLFELPEKENEYQKIKQKLDKLEGYVNRLLDLKAEHSVAKAGSEIYNYEYLKTAELPTVPIAPRRNFIWFISILVAILLSIIILVVRYILHNTIISIDDIASKTKASILGMVPTVYTNLPSTGIVVSHNPKSIVSEALRTLRSNMQFMGSFDGPRTIAMTSTISGEGKTFIAINLGSILSFLDKKVVVLDLDMRRPRMSKIFDVENDRGMSTILIGKDNVSDCIHKTELDNLDFITSGPIPPNPAELILSQKLEETVQELKKKYDFIIFDTPPLGLVTDGLDIVKKVDFPIYIFRADYSSKSFIDNLDRLVDENGVKKLSVVLNDVGRGVSGYYYGYGGYGYAYGYGYGFGYYSDETKPQKTLLKRIFSRKK